MRIALACLIATTLDATEAGAADHRDGPIFSPPAQTAAPVDVQAWPNKFTTPSEKLGTGTGDGFLSFGASPALPDGVPGVTPFGDRPGDRN